MKLTLEEKSRIMDALCYRSFSLKKHAEEIRTYNEEWAKQSEKEAAEYYEILVKINRIW